MRTCVKLTARSFAQCALGALGTAIFMQSAAAAPVLQVGGLEIHAEKTFVVALAAIVVLAWLLIAIWASRQAAESLDQASAGRPPGMDRLSQPRSLMCRIWGHDLNPEASYYYALCYCNRCVHEVPEDETGLREWLGVRFWLLRRSIAYTVSSWRAWITCPECGLHFGRHDQKVDHLPF